MTSNGGLPPDRSALMHIAINAIDLDQTLRFYRDVFGFVRTYTWSRAQAVDTGQVLFEGSGTYLDVGGGAYLEFFTTGTAGQSMDGSAVPHLSLSVTDLDTVYERALELGGRPKSTEGPSHWDGRPTVIDLNGEPVLREKVAYVEGPNGEAIEIYEVLTPVVTT